VSPSFHPASFRRLALSNFAAQAAEQLSLAAVPMLAVLRLDAGAAEIGLLGAAQTLPFLLLALPLGVLADRMPRRRLMLAAEGLRAVALLGLLAAMAGGCLSLWAMALLGFLGAVGTVAFNVAAPGLVSVLVPRPSLPRANAQVELARSAAFTAGPAAAGALVAWWGADAAFVLAAMLSAGAAAWLLPVREPRVTPAAGGARHPLRELAAGARFVWVDRLLRPVLLTALVWNLSWFVLQAAYVPHAVRSLGLDAQGVGLTLAAYGAGMVAGALVAARVMGALPLGRALQVGPLVSVLAIALMLATLAVPSAPLAAASLFLFGGGPLVWIVGTTTLRQTVTPPELLGRVSALFLTANAGARPIGALLGAAAGAAWGEAACLWLACAGFLLQAAIISPSGSVRQVRAAGPA